MHSSACRHDAQDAMSRFSLAAQAAGHPLHLASPCDTCQAREFSACASLTAEEQKRLAALMRTINIEPHCPIFDEADPAEYVYTITAGTVKIYKLLGDGRRQITGFLFAEDFLGLTHNEAYAYSAEALVPTRLCRFPRRRLEALLVEIPHLEQRLLAMASHELAAAQDQMVLLDDVAEILPKYRDLSIPDMITSTVREPLAALNRAIQAKDSNQFSEAYGRLTASCNTCHQSYDRAAIVIRLPTVNSFPDQDFRTTTK